MKTVAEKPQLVYIHAVKEFNESKGQGSLIFTLGAGWRWAVSFTRLSFHTEKVLHVRWKRRCGATETIWKEKILPLPLQKSKETKCWLKERRKIEKTEKDWTLIKNIDTEAYTIKKD